MALMRFLGFTKEDLCPRVLECLKSKKRLCNIDGLQCAIKVDSVTGNTIREMIVDWKTGKYIAMDTSEKYS